MNGAAAVCVAVAFVWLGMVVAISFVEAPLKFRAPNVTLKIGLSIGRIVFRALNAIELVFAMVVVVTIVAGRLPVCVTTALAVAIAALGVQVVVVRPRLVRRSDLVLAGLDAPRSRGHVAYVGLEVVKSLALVAGGVLLLWR